MRPQTPRGRGCYSVIKVCFSGNSRETSWEAARTDHLDAERDPPTSVTTFPSVTEQFRIAPVMKGETMRKGEGCLGEEYFFGYQQRYSQILVYFLPFLRPGHLYAAGSLRRISPRYIRFSMA